MKRMIAAACAVLLLVACNQKEQTKDLLLTGNIEGLKKGKLQIKRFVDTNWITIDSILFDGDSKFERELELASPEMFTLQLDRGVSENIDVELLFFAEPGKINIDTDLEKFYSKAKITGSKNNALYEEYKKVQGRYTDQQLELAVAGFNALKEGKPFSKEENDAKIEALKKRKYLYAINFAKNHGDSDIAPYIALYEIADTNVKYLDTIQNALSPKVANGKYGKELSKYIAERKRSESDLK